MRRSAIVTAILAASVISAPASAGIDRQLWTTATVNVKLSDKWRLQEDITGRLSDERNGLYEVESNSLIGYRINKIVTVWAGYTHDPQYSSGDFTVMEHRLREQVTFDNVVHLGAGTVSARMRMEERWRRHFDGTGWRMRPYVKYLLPLGAGSKTALVLSSEMFINVNTTRFQRQSGLERMRNLIAISTPVSKRVTAEIGYLNQHGFVRHGPDTSDHVLSLAFTLNL